jgi:hypothetical protein
VSPAKTLRGADALVVLLLSKERLELKDCA